MATLGAALGLPDVISFDMGGTTAKASLIEKGETKVINGYHIGGPTAGHPMMLPVVDIVEVGAGGGSIAWIDAGGGLKVGPLSAGSAPGPACYGKGGTEPTITDANLVLGRLDANNFLGGQMRLGVEAARRAIADKIAGPLVCRVEESALGIIKIADSKMSLAVREVSVAKGHDPRQFALDCHRRRRPVARRQYRARTFAAESHYSGAARDLLGAWECSPRIYAMTTSAPSLCR